MQHILMFAGVIALVAYRHPALVSAISGFSCHHRGNRHIWRAGLRADMAPLAGWLLTFAFAYHLLYVFIHHEGRRDLLLMMPGKKDFQDLYHNVLYFTGKRNKPPQFGRFSYFEKFDYWAAFWGCVIMIGTGLIMLYPHKATCFTT
jgi:formate dehydrogenase subunit gamma